MCNRIYNFFNKNNLYPLKFGFRQTYSTVLALISFPENIRKIAHEDNTCCGIFVDYQKVFDTVEHDILLSNLGHNSIYGLAN